MSSFADGRACRATRAWPRLVGALVVAAAGLAVASPAASREGCVAPGTWVVPGADGPRPVSAAALLSRLARQSVLLLGETHESAEDHRWQLHTIAALHGLRPDLALGFEMFPRRVQPALDRWVAGELSEAEFLRESDWDRVWGFDAALYLPLFHFARMHRLPMLALNVERALVRKVREQGWDAVPEAEREGVSRPAAPPPEYVRQLEQVYAGHRAAGPAPAGAAPGTTGEPAGDRDDPGLRRFVEAQQTWDRAMAQVVAASVSRPGAPLVIAIAGAGHAGRHAVPHQLDALGVKATATLLTWGTDADCGELKPGVAEAVFGLGPAAAGRAAQPGRPRLGVTLGDAEDQVKVTEVAAGSIAEAAGIRAGDVITELAGRPVRTFRDVVTAVRRQAPGTWLPLKVRRGEATVEVVAKFPPAP